jgi:hypothetical protein
MQTLTIPFKSTAGYAFEATVELDANGVPRVTEVYQKRSDVFLELSNVPLQENTVRATNFLGNDVDMELTPRFSLNRVEMQLCVVELVPRELPLARVNII